MLSRQALTITLLSVCAGCTQGPNYKRPIVAVPESYRFDDPVVVSAQPSARWWTAFGDRNLERLIQECVSNNRDLRIATSRVNESEAILRGTRSQGLPQIGYGLTGSRQRTSGQILPLPNPVSSTFTSILSASWELDLWGRIRRETEAARANLLATTEARRGVILTLVASLTTSYVTLLDLDRRLQVAETTLAGREESVAIFRKRLLAGYISEFEMSQVEAEYESAVVAIPDLQQAIAVQESSLSVLLGRNPGKIERSRSLTGLTMPTVPASLPADLLGRRPDILRAEQELIASNALIGAARALYFPRISLTGLGGRASKSLADLFTGSARTWTYTGDAAGPIYTGGGLKAATDQAIARREQALASYEQTVQNAFREVEDALIAVRSSREAQQSFERRVASLARGVTLARARYDNGYADYIVVLDTERSLFSAQIALAAAQGDTYRAMVNLYRALGGDWIDQADGLSAMQQPPTKQVQ